MIILLIVCITISTVFAIWKVPVWQLAGRKASLDLDKYLNLENEYRKTIAQIIGGLYVLGGFAFTWFQFLATQDTILISQERLITDRYSKAIDQLGGQSTQTRLGGIYALGSIEKTSPDYIAMVDNVLASYIRQNYQHQDSALREELQASINILTKKQFKLILNNNLEEGLNLSNVTLNRFDFSSSLLQKGKLNGSDLDRSIFIKANLSESEGYGANFIGANLTNAFLDNVQFYGVDFTQALLTEASMKNSNFKLAKFKEANLSNVDLSGSDLSEANFERTKLYGANLQGTIGLTKNQIRSALINSETKLPIFNLLDE